MSGKLEMIVMDWAGTAIDFGSIAPILALETVFRANKLRVPREILRRSMGLAKRDHIRDVLSVPEIASLWQQEYGNPPAEQDVDRLYEAFTPRMMDEISVSAVLIPGVLEFAQALRARGIKIGATTGYTQSMMKQVIARTAPLGYLPDLTMCPEDVGGGRPNPWMCCRLAEMLKISAMSACVKIGDTVSDIHEGLNAGMWTVGVTTTGNSVGLSLEEWSALDAGAQSKLRSNAEQLLRDAGAHYVVDSAADALPLVEEIESRISCGDRP